MTVEFTREFDAAFAENDSRQLVTVVVGSQMFGLPILKVRDVFVVSELTPVPLAPASVAGLFNLRGRVMTILSMRAILGLEVAACTSDDKSIGIEWHGESFGLLVDEVGEVISLTGGVQETNPVGLDPRWADLSTCIHRLSDKLLIELSLDALFGEKLAKAA